VKDEGFNLNTLTNVLKSIVKCETLGLEKKIQRTCFDHVFSKTCQYATKFVRTWNMCLLNLPR
jgi:hypothetical protein